MRYIANDKIELLEVTPQDLRCCIGTCPAIFETNRGTVVVVGTVLDNDMVQTLLHNKVGEDEMAVEIPKAYLEGLTIK